MRFDCSKSTVIVSTNPKGTDLPLVNKVLRILRMNYNFKLVSETPLENGAVRFHLTDTKGYKVSEIKRACAKAKEDGKNLHENQVNVTSVTDKEFTFYFLDKKKEKVFITFPLGRYGQYDDIAPHYEKLSFLLREQYNVFLKQRNAILKNLILYFKIYNSPKNIGRIFKFMTGEDFSHVVKKSKLNRNYSLDSSLLKNPYVITLNFESAINGRNYTLAIYTTTRYMSNYDRFSGEDVAKISIVTSDPSFDLTPFDDNDSNTRAISQFIAPNNKFLTKIIQKYFD